VLQPRTEPVLSALPSATNYPPDTNTHINYRGVQHLSLHVRFEVFTAVTMKNVVFWDVAPCISCVNRRLEGGDTFLRNVCSHRIYTAPRPRRRHSSSLIPVYTVYFIPMIVSFSEGCSRIRIREHKTISISWHKFSFYPCFPSLLLDGHYLFFL
jgi:hypothetical protein